MAMYNSEKLINNIKDTLIEEMCGLESPLELLFADVKCDVMNPSEDYNSSNWHEGAFCTGGLVWNLPKGRKIEDYLLFWIGSDNAAFSNVVLTFNGCDIVRYDTVDNCVLTDMSQQKRILKRRYYLVEKAKDANIIGILVGTLGVGMIILIPYNVRNCELMFCELRIDV